MGEMADEAFDRAMDELEHLGEWDYEDDYTPPIPRRPQGFPVIKPADDNWFKDKQKKVTK